MGAGVQGGRRPEGTQMRAGKERRPGGGGANSLEEEEEDGGAEDEQQREREDAAVAGQHEAAAAVEAVAAREHLPLTPRPAAQAPTAAAAAAAAPARCSGRGPGARSGGRGGAGAARPGGGERRGGPGADLLVLAVLHAAGRGPRLRAPRAGRAAPGPGRAAEEAAALAGGLARVGPLRCRPAPPPGSLGSAPRDGPRKLQVRPPRLPLGICAQTLC